MEITIDELNYLLEREFERGRNSVIQNVTTTPYIIDKEILVKNTIAGTNPACALCSKNPANGGDGICNCTLGDMKVMS